MATSGTRKQCRECGTPKPKSDYSNNQWKKKDATGQHIGMCKICQAAAGHPHAQPAVPPLATHVTPVAPVANAVPVTPPEGELSPSEKDVKEWLGPYDKLLPTLRSKLGEEFVNMEIVKEITEDDLKKWGVPEVPRRALMKKIETLKSNPPSGRGDGGESKQAGPTRSEMDALNAKCKEFQKAAGLSVGCSVEWREDDEDVPKGTVGVIKSVSKGGLIRVEFPSGSWNFDPSKLKPSPPEMIERSDGAGESKQSEKLTYGFTVGKAISFAWNSNNDESKLTVHSGKITAITNGNVTIDDVCNIGNHSRDAKPITVRTERFVHLVEAVRDMLYQGRVCMVMMTAPLGKRSATKRPIIHYGKISQTKGDQIVLEMHGPGGIPGREFKHIIKADELREKIVEAEVGFACGEKVRIFHKDKGVRDGRVSRVAWIPGRGYRVFVVFKDDQAKDYVFAPDGLRKLQNRSCYIFKQDDDVEDLYVKEGDGSYNSRTKRVVRLGKVIKVTPNADPKKLSESKVTVKFDEGTVEWTAQELFWRGWHARTGFNIGDELCLKITRRGFTSYSYRDCKVKAMLRQEITVRFSDDNTEEKYHASELRSLLHSHSFTWNRKKITSQ